jgi:plastocyanin
MAEHVIRVGVREKAFKYNKECFCVDPGDTIIWKFHPKLPFGIVIKALISPLNWSHRASGPGKDIVANVRKGAAPGLYRYAVGTFDGQELLIDDPEIIVKPPKGN